MIAAVGASRTATRTAVREESLGSEKRLRASSPFRKRKSVPSDNRLPADLGTSAIKA